MKRIMKRLSLPEKEKGKTVLRRQLGKCGLGPRPIFYHDLEL